MLQRDTERQVNKRRGVEVFCFFSSGMRVQPAGFGCGLSFNANGVPTILPVTVLLHYICWGWGALITLTSLLLTGSFSFSFHDTCAALSVLFVLSLFRHLSSIHSLCLCVRLSSFLTRSARLSPLSSCHRRNGWSPTVFQRGFTKHIAQVQILTSFFVEALCQSAFEYPLALIGPVGVKPLSLTVHCSYMWTTATQRKTVGVNWFWEFLQYLS